MKKLAATLLAACLLCGGLMTGVLADTWEPDEFNAWMTDNVGSIDENTTPEELDEIIDKLSNAEIVLPEEGDGLTGSMTAGSYEEASISSLPSSRRSWPKRPRAPPRIVSSPSGHNRRSSPGPPDT